MAESGPLGVLLKASVGDAARFCASRDRQSTGNSRSKPHGPKTRASCVVVQNVPLGALISKRPAAPAGGRDGGADDQEHNLLVTGLEA